MPGRSQARGHSGDPIAQLYKRPEAVIGLLDLHLRKITPCHGEASGVTTSAYGAAVGPTHPRGAHTVLTHPDLSNQATYGLLGLPQWPSSRVLKAVSARRRVCATALHWIRLDTNHPVHEMVSVPQRAAGLSWRRRGTRQKPSVSPQGSQPSISGADSVPVEVGEGVCVYE